MLVGFLIKFKVTRHYDAIWCSYGLIQGCQSEGVLSQKIHGRGAIQFLLFKTWRKGLAENPPLTSVKEERTVKQFQS